MATIRDIAKRAKVSIGTVSNVINNHPGVSPKTRKVVSLAIEELNYHPVAAARALSNNRTYKFGIIRAELLVENNEIEHDPFIADFVTSLTRVAIVKNVGITFWTRPAGDEVMDLYREIVMGRQVDGFIINGLRYDDERIEYLKTQQFPYVILGRPDPPTSHYWADVDSEYGIKLAVDHLAELGHKRIAFIAPPDGFILTLQRLHGFKKAMNLSNLSVVEKYIYYGNFNASSGKAGMQYLLDLQQPPTAVICNNDRMAMGAIHEAQAQKLIVGKDVSIIGYDDISLAKYMNPSLTTIRQPIVEVGEYLFDMLYKLIYGESNDIPESKVFRPELCIRNSTGIFI